MKRWIWVLLACGMLTMLAGCGGEDLSQGEKAASASTAEENSEGVGSQEGEAPEVKSSPEEEKELTLAQGEARLAYANGDVLAVVYHGPYKDIGMSFCDKEGNSLDDLFLGYGDLNPGWTLAVTYDMSEAYSIDQLGLHVSDYDAPRNPDNTYANQVYTDFGEPMTDEERKEIGFDFLDGRCCIISQGRGTCGSDNFGIYASLSWFCDNYNRETGEIDIEGFVDKFQFFTGDGTPLGEAYEGYRMEITEHGTEISALLYKDDENDQEKHKEMADQLMEGKPYAIYTNDDGSTVTIPLGPHW